MFLLNFHLDSSLEIKITSKNISNLFVNLCHARGQKPTLLVSTLWYDGGESVGTTEMYGKTLKLEEHFQKSASAAIHLISYSIRFDGSHDRISACNAIDLLMLDSEI